MKLLTSLLLLLSLSVSANPEMNSEDNYSHLPLNANNANNELNIGGVSGHIVKNGDGTADGLLIYKVKGYPAMDTEFSEDTAPGLTCELVEGNGTQYNSEDWESTYEIDGLDDFKEAFGSIEGDDNYERDFDYDENGVINFSDLAAFNADAEVTYRLECRNGVQQ